MKNKLLIIFISIFIIFGITACGSKNQKVDEEKNILQEVNVTNISKIKIYNYDKEIVDKEKIKEIYNIITAIKLDKVENSEKIDLSTEGGYSKLSFVLDDKEIEIVSRSDKYISIDGVWYKADKYLTRSELEKIANK